MLRLGVGREVRGFADGVDELPRILAGERLRVRGADAGDQVDRYGLRWCGRKVVTQGSHAGDGVVVDEAAVLEGDAVDDDFGEVGRRGGRCAAGFRYGQIAEVRWWWEAGGEAFGGF